MAINMVVGGCARSPREDAPRPGGEHAGARYHCPMHPTYVSDRPGDCPICNMALVPVEATHAPPGQAVAGRASIVLSPERRQLIGLATTAVEPRELVPVLRTVGRVTYAEPNVSVVSSRVGGWVEKLYVDTTGRYVTRGEPLVELFSPDWIAAQREYRVAEGEVRAALRQRLELWDIPADQLGELDRAREVRGTVTLVAPRDGYVIEKAVLAGKSVAPGEELYRLADLAVVWILADVYEQELARVRVGQRVFVTARRAGVRPVVGRVSSIDPRVEPATRSVKARIEVRNPELEFRPGMYVEVGVELEPVRALAVPASAVLDTGLRQIAFVDAGEGRLEPRELQLGVRTDDFWEVVRGVAEGERVVTRALFLVDSESQLKAAIAGMTAADEHRH